MEWDINRRWDFRWDINRRWGFRWEISGRWVSSKGSTMRDYWKMCADLLRDGVLQEADARSLKVAHQDGCTTFEFDEGLTQELYNFLAPLLSTDSEKAELALGVIAKKLPALSCVDWLELKSILYNGGEDFEERLPKQICLEGFDALAKEIEESWTEHRLTHPATNIQVIGLVHPTWDSSSGTLSFGNNRWEFRVIPGGPLKALLDEFEKCNWPPSVTLGRLDPEQVRDVAKELRKKTKGYIKWKASSDSTMGWQCNL
jgi:hypothetical protein